MFVLKPKKENNEELEIFALQLELTRCTRKNTFSLILLNLFHTIQTISALFLNNKMKTVEIF